VIVTVTLQLVVHGFTGDWNFASTLIAFAGGVAEIVLPPVVLHENDVLETAGQESGGPLVPRCTMSVPVSMGWLVVV
jgi:hypothetical protein